MLNVTNERFVDEYQVLDVPCRQNHPISKTGIDIIFSEWKSQMNV